jgi:uncharacterized protein involved in exopolysaccharide biosynthesis
MASEGKKGSVHDLLRLVFRRRVLFLVGALLFAIAVLVASHFMPLKYSGKTIFEFGLEAAAEEISRTSKESFGTIKERLVHDLCGYQAMESAIKELHLTEGLPHDSGGRLTDEGRAALQEMVRASMAATNVVWEARSKQEDLVSVSFTHPDPKLAENVPNILVRNYINRTYERIRSGLKRQHDFLRIKVEDTDKQLAEATREKIDFETRHAGMLPDNPAAFQEKIERCRAELKAARGSYEKARLKLARLDALRVQSTTTAPAEHASMVVKQPNPEYGRLKVQLHDLVDELDTSLVLKHMTEEHPTVRALRVKIAQTKRRLAEAPNEVIKERVFASGTELIELSMAAAGAQSELEAAQNEIGRLENLSREYDKAWANFAPVRQGYLALLKKVNDSAAEAHHWRTRLESIQIALTAAVDNRLTRLKAVQPAQQQFLPSSPSLPAVLGLAVGGGLAFGAGLVFLAKTLDRTIRTPVEASEYFDLPVHGVISEIVTPAQRAGRLLKRWFLRPVICLILLVSVWLGGISAIYRLRRPEKYQEFWNSPSGFVGGQIYPLVDRVLDHLKG